MNADLAEVWARDRPMTTAETSARRLRRLERELAKIGEKWSLSDTVVSAGKGKGRASKDKVDNSH